MNFMFPPLSRTNIKQKINADHEFYDDAAGFDAFAETTCKPYYRGEDGRAIDSARPVLPDAHGRLLRGDQL
jgi:hypothetical protein